MLLLRYFSRYADAIADYFRYARHYASTAIYTSMALRYGGALCCARVMLYVPRAKMFEYACRDAMMPRYYSRYPPP